jgi:HNH endonuclease
MSLPVAKNAMRRAIEALYYRPLNKKEKDRVWEFFNSRCAYCDRQIDRSLRHGHMDHLDCSAAGGGNYIRNRVLACKECNGNEKRELQWERFLKSKSKIDQKFVSRRNRIRRWQVQFPELDEIVLTSEGELAKAELEETINAFQEKFARFRDLLYAAKRKKGTPSGNAT